ncbi:transposon protein, CACTA, En/Spm sub-class [Tanacetum coccineum]
MLPKNNELTTSTYKANKLMCPLGLEVTRIDACQRDYILYANGYKDLHKCLVCKVSKYKDTNLKKFDEDVTKNGSAAKVLWYLPVIPRLEKLFSNPKNAKLLWWHANDRKIDGKMTHVGPKQPGNDIIVYLEPLIDDMIDLWYKGFEVYDVYKKERFKLFAMIFYTISDFTAYGNLSGYETKEEKACPVSEKDTHLRWLTNCKKTVHMGHRRSLPESHPYRKKLFNGKIESRRMA